MQGSVWIVLPGFVVWGFGGAGGLVVFGWLCLLVMLLFVLCSR